MQRAVTAMLGVLSCATSAFADGMPQKQADPYAYTPGPVFVDYDWSGIYLGGHLGGAYAQFEWTFTTPTESFEKSRTAFAGGVQVGLQKQWRSIVIGAEVSYTWTDLETTTNSIAEPGTSRSAGLSNLLLATGRLGFAQDYMMAYAKAGYASADVDFRSSITSTGVVTTTSSGREQGWVAGVGMDYAWKPNILIGVEYNYIHLSVDGRTQIPTPSGLAGSVVNDAGIDIQTLMARINFKFGGGAVPGY